VKVNGPGKKARVGALPCWAGPNNPGPLAPAHPILSLACSDLRATASAATPCAARSLSLAPSYRRRRSTAGAEAFIGLFAGEEHTPGIPTPSLPFPPCETEPQTLDLKLLAYSAI